MLQVKGLSKSFETHGVVQKALDGISVSFPNREMVFVVGQSGSGKSTFLNMMAGFSVPDSGDVLFYGKSVTGMSERELDFYHYQDIAFIFQNYCILEELTVEENVALGIQESPKRAFDSVTEVLDRVGLLFQREKKAKYLSGGEKQRVAIARAILKNPSVIFADEPAGNLDRVSSGSVFSLLKECSKERFVIIVSHNLMDAYGCGDRILTLDQGKVVDDRSLSERKTDPSIAYIDGTSFLDDSYIDRLNGELRKGNVTRLMSKEDTFEKTGDVPSDSSMSDHIKIQGSVFRPFASAFKGIYQNWFKVAFFSIVTSMLLVLFYHLCSVSYSESYEVTLNHSEYYRKSDNMTVFKSEVGIDSDREKNKQVVADASGDHDGTESLYQEAFTLYRFRQFMSTDSQVVLYDDYRTTSDRNSIYYPKLNRGLLVCNEEYIRKNLQVDRMEFVRKASEFRKSGVYMSDYLADCFIQNSSGFYSSYDDLVGQLKFLYYAGYPNTKGFYVNGIIKTDYQNRYPELFDLLSSKRMLGNFNLDYKYQEGIDYINNALMIFYATDADFFEDVVREDTKGVLPLPLSFDLGNDESDVCSPILVARNPKLNGNECIVSPKIKSWISDFDERNYDEKNPFGFRKRLYSVDGNFAFSDPCLFTKVYLSSRHPELVVDNGVMNSGIVSIEVSDDVFLRLFREDCIPFGYHFHHVKDKEELYRRLEGKNYRLIAEGEASTKMFYEFLSIFKKTFRLMGCVCLVIALISVFLYSYALIRQNRYGIGVMRALGYGGEKLSLYLLSRFSVFAVLVCVCYVVFDHLFVYLGNGIVSKLIRKLIVSVNWVSRPF